MKQSERYYRSIRENTLRLTEPNALDAVRQAFDQVESRYPEAVFPPTYLVIGRLSSGGTTSDSGLLVGTEFYARAPDSPLDELDAFALSAVRDFEVLPNLIAHEHLHILQSRVSRMGAGDGDTLSATGSPPRTSAGTENVPKVGGR